MTGGLEDRPYFSRQVRASHSPCRLETLRRFTKLEDDFKGKKRRAVSDYQSEQ